MTGTAPNLIYSPATRLAASGFTFEAQDKALVSDVATVSIAVVAPPSSDVAELPAVINSTSFALSWSGTDSPGGGGIVSYSIYESEDNGPFTALLDQHDGHLDDLHRRVWPLVWLLQRGDRRGGLHAGDAGIGASLDDAARTSPPVAAGQSVVTGENEYARAITLSATDTDGDSLTYTIVSTPAQWNINRTAPNLIYSPQTGYAGSDSFTFEAQDNSLASNISTVSIAVVAPPASSVAALPAVIQSTSFMISSSGTDSTGGRRDHVV